MNHEVIEASLTKLNGFKPESSHIPASIWRHLAERMVVEGHTEDDNWIQTAVNQTVKYLDQKRQEAQADGYAPFIFMGKAAHEWITQNCAVWVLPAMETPFRDPEDIHPDWAVQCAKTMSLIGKDECAAQSDLYTFLSQHPEWNVQKRARDQFHLEQNNLRRKQYQSTREPRDSRERSPRPPMRDSRDNRDTGNRYNSPRNTGRQNQGSSEVQTIPGTLELTLKVNQVPDSPITQDDSGRSVRMFAVRAGDNVVQIALEPSSYDRMVEASQKWNGWVAVLSGALSSNDSSLRMNSPLVQIYESQR